MKRKYSDEQLESARSNTTIKAECPDWMQKLFESAPSGKLWWYRRRTKNWWTSVDKTWSGGIYRISMIWNGEIEDGEH